MTVLLRQLHRIAAWSSQTINVFLFLGSQNQSVSARCYVNRHDPKWNALRIVVNALFFWQEDHCHKSHKLDLKWAKEILE